MKKRIEKSKKKVILKTFLEYIFITIGAALAAYSLEAILVPNSILDGGVTGISIILNLLFNAKLGVCIFIINIPFLYIGFKNLGYKFLIKAIYSIAIYSVMLEFLGKVTTPLTEDILLATVYGSALLGVGVGLVIKSGGCLDGTESVGIVVSKNTTLSVGQFVLICNAVIFTVAGIFFGIDRALFSLLAYFITSKIVDEVSEGMEKGKAAMIITDAGNEVADKIYSKIGRTVTKLEGKGLISKGEKDVLYCVITRIEISELRSIVEEVDASAFVTITDVSEIIGNHIKLAKGEKKEK